MESPLCPPDGTCLIETFGYAPGQPVRRQELHLDRMARSAVALGYPFDRERARKMMDTVAADHPLRCRMTLAADGALELTHAPLPPNPAEWRVALSGVRLQSGDPWLGHKTTQRAVYDAARAAMPDGVDEVILLNERGELCEGSITNLFVTQGGQRLTPPLSCGLLPGVLRAELLAQGQAQEKVLSPEDLARASRIEMGNSLRGLIPAQIA